MKHKTEHYGHERLIAIGPRAQQILLPFLLRPADAFCFSPKESERKRREAMHAQRKTPLARGNKPGSNRRAAPKRSAGDQYDASSYRRAIQRGCAAAKVARWFPHQLRHTRGTAIRKSYGLDAAQVVLGHSQLATTQIYAEKNLGLAISVAREVG
jgi:integrase